MQVEVGILLIKYRGANDEQPIRWVHVDDFVNLQRFIASGKEQAAEAARLKAEIERLRALGVTEKELKAAGVDAEKLHQLSTENQLWPIHSYNIVSRRGISWLQINRTHRLDTRRITSVRLVRRQRVDD